MMKENKTKSGMKNNLNFGLLILIIAILISFTSAAIYYQTTFKTVSDEYKSKMSELQKVTSTLLEKKAELAETTAKEQTLKEKYTGVRTEKEELEEDIDELQDQLDDKTNELINTKIALDDEIALSESYQREKDNCEDDKSDYLGYINDLCDNIIDPSNYAGCD